MPSLTDTRDAAIVALRAALPSVPRVEAFSGEMSLEAVKKKVVKGAPALFVAVAEAQNNADRETCCFDLVAVFGAFAVTRNVDAERGEADALAVAQAASLVIHGATFGLSGVGPAYVVNLSALPDEELTAEKITVWSVTWLQSVAYS